MLKKLISKILISFFLFLLSAAAFGQTKAAFLEFDRKTVSANLGDIFDINVMVDSGSEQISSIDAYVIYDPSFLEAVSVTPASFFPTVIHNITAGNIYIAGLVDSSADYKAGAGAAATITFRTLNNGTGTVSYDCQPGVYNSSKVIKNDLNATNVIECDQNGNSIITVGSVTPGEGTGTLPQTGGGTPMAGTYAPTQPGGGKYATTSAIPKLGVFENVSNVALPGVILLLLGGALRIIL